MNKRNIIFTLLLFACTLVQAYDYDPECESDRKRRGYPHYYCPCIKDAREFYFGMTETISDTVWFSATVPDLRKGISAYWFSDCSIQLEAYAFCHSVGPTITMTVGKDQMREMDVADINRKLDEMGQLGSFIQDMKVKLRVYPIGGGSGTVMVYPYEVGPESACDAPIRVVNGMTVVSSHAEDVFELRPETMVANRQMFVQWKQKKNLPAEIVVRQGGCDGTIVDRVQLSDSTKLYYPSMALISEMKSKDESLYFSVLHDENVVGRMLFRTTAVFEHYETDTTLCQGLEFRLADTTLTNTTVFGPDSVWMTRDSVGIYQYTVNFTAPEPMMDTMLVRKNQVPFWYKGTHVVTTYGDYDFLHHVANQCDERYLLHVEHLVDTVRTVGDTTICVGKTIDLGSQTYSEDADVEFEDWLNDDTWQIVNMHLHFQEPELEYDTIYITAEQLGRYKYPESGTYIRQFGTQTLTITKRGECKRIIELTVLETEELSVEKAAATDERRYHKVIENGVMYIQCGQTRYSIVGDKR